MSDVKVVAAKWVCRCGSSARYALRPQKALAEHDAAQVLGDNGGILENLSGWCHSPLNPLLL